MLEGLHEVRVRIAEIEAGLSTLRRGAATADFHVLVEGALAGYTADWAASTYGLASLSPDRTAMAERLRGYMRSRLFNPELAAHADDFVEAAARYGVDWRLGVALATVESSGGKYCFRPHNPFGIMGRSFSSWRDAVWEVNRLVASYGFGNDLRAILHKYNPSGGEAYINKVLSEMSRV